MPLDIARLVEKVCSQLEKLGKKLFVDKPTIYVFSAKDKLLITLCDEKKPKAELKTAKEPISGCLSFFVSRFMIDDFLSEGEQYIDSLAVDKVREYLEAVRENAAYSRNLRRSQELTEDGHHFAATVFLVSAFENAMRDLFFRNNDLWFLPLQSTSVELLAKYGTPLVEKDDRKFRTVVVLGDKRWGFSDADHQLYQEWENIEYKTAVFNLVKQLRILDDYLLDLTCNHLSEIGSYEILKRTLGNDRTQSSINFQMVDGKGGVKWAFNKFFGIDLQGFEKDLQIIKDATLKRHKIIHGFLEEEGIDEAYVKQVRDSVTRIVAFVNNEILNWAYIL